MVKTKLVELLAKFNEEEIKTFETFIHSPYCNNSKRVIQLFNLLNKEYPEFNETKIQKSKVFKKIFGTKPYNEALLRNVVSDLYTLCEQFIAMEMLKKNTVLKAELNNKFYSEKNLFIHGSQAINDGKKELAKVKFPDSDYFFWNFKMFQNTFSNDFNLKFRGNLNKLYKKADLEILIQNLDDYYLSELGILIGELHNSYTVHGNKFDVTYYVRRIDFYLENEKQLHPLVAYRLKHCRMLLTENQEMYAEVKSDFIKLSKLMDRSAKLSSIVELHGFASSQAWKGNKFFLNELDEMVLLREKNNLILDEGNKVNPIAFWNFSNSKVRKSGRKDTVAFINKYKKHLPESSAEETVNMVYASINISEKKFADAIAILLKINKPFFSSEVALRRMLLKCYFETQQWQLLLNYIENTKKFIQNSAGKITPYILDPLKKYSELLYHLFRFTQESNDKSKMKVEQILKENLFPYEEEWAKDIMNSYILKKAAR